MKPKLLMKLKVFVLIGAGALVLLFGLMIWAGVSAIGILSEKTASALQSPAARASLEQLKAGVERLPDFNPLVCWGSAQSLMQLKPWLERPALRNLSDLKTACLRPPPEPAKRPSGGEII